MKTLGKALGAVAIAGALAAGGSAFTAGNAGVPTAKTLGYASTTITGVTATVVTYVLDSGKENITHVDLTLLGDTTTKVVQIAFGAAASSPTPVTCADATNASGLYAAGSTTYHCAVTQAVATAEKFVLVAS
jgi:hypothetical protein